MLDRFCPPVDVEQRVPRVTSRSSSPVAATHQLRHMDLRAIGRFKVQSNLTLMVAPAPPAGAAARSAVDGKSAAPAHGFGVSAVSAGLRPARGKQKHTSVGEGYSDNKDKEDDLFDATVTATTGSQAAAHAASVAALQSGFAQHSVRS